jgi:hypothetical protein
MAEVERYTFTQADVAGCRQIVARLEDLDAKTGGYAVGSVQGHRKSATATVHYRLEAGPAATSDAISYVLDNADIFGTLAKKVVAHFETHPEQIGGADHG